MGPALALIAATAWTATIMAVGNSHPRWTGLVDPSSHCYYAVPPAWRTADEVPLGSQRATTESESDVWLQSNAPDGSVVLVVAWREARTWREHVAAQKALLRPTLVIAETAERLAIEYASPLPGIHRYAAVRSASGACGMYLDVLPRASAEVRAAAEQVLGTLASLR